MDHLRSLKKPVTKTVRLLSDMDLGDSQERAKDEVLNLRRQAKMMGSRITPEEIKTAEDKLAELTKTIDDQATVWRFQSLGRRKYEDLVSKHPPSDEDRKRVVDAGGEAKDAAWNEKTFPPALLAASLTDPALTEEEAIELFEGNILNGSEIMELFLAAMEVNNKRRVVEAGNV